MRYRLDLDSLRIDTFDPVVVPLTEPSDPLFVEWTGCDSACTACGMEPMTQFPQM